MSVPRDKICTSFMISTVAFRSMSGDRQPSASIKKVRWPIHTVKELKLTSKKMAETKDKIIGSDACVQA